MPTRSSSTPVARRSTSTRRPAIPDLDADVFVGSSVVASPGRSKLVAAVVAALLTVLAIILWNRRRQ